MIRQIGDAAKPGKIPKIPRGKAEAKVHGQVAVVIIRVVHIRHEPRFPLRSGRLAIPGNHNGRAEDAIGGRVRVVHAAVTRSIAVVLGVIRRACRGDGLRTKERPAAGEFTGGDAHSVSTCGEALKQIVPYLPADGGAGGGPDDLVAAVQELQIHTTHALASVKAPVVVVVPEHQVAQTVVGRVVVERFVAKAEELQVSIAVVVNAEAINGLIVRQAEARHFKDRHDKRLPVLVAGTRKARVPIIAFIRVGPTCGAGAADDDCVGRRDHIAEPVQWAQHER